MDEESKMYFEVLELDPGATKEEIKTAYRQLAQVWHPDRFPVNSKLQEKAQRKLVEINNAYDQLQNYQQRNIPKKDEIIITENDLLNAYGTKKKKVDYEYVFIMIGLGLLLICFIIYLFSLPRPR